jgi:hypothetical protein
MNLESIGSSSAPGQGPSLFFALAAASDIACMRSQVGCSCPGSRMQSRITRRIFRGSCMPPQLRQSAGKGGPPGAPAAGITRGSSKAHLHAASGQGLVTVSERLTAVVAVRDHAGRNHRPFASIGSRRPLAIKAMPPTRVPSLAPLGCREPSRAPGSVAAWARGPRARAGSSRNRSSG